MENNVLRKLKQIGVIVTMTTVLSTSLLGCGYLSRESGGVEDSRAQKEDSVMREVTNAIEIAMSDEEIFNEVLKYSCYDNYSCYTDQTSMSSDNRENLKIITSEKDSTTENDDKKTDVEQYMYDDGARRDKKVPYNPNGVMRGVTLTFSPTIYNDVHTFAINDARVNNMHGENRNTAAGVQGVGNMKAENDKYLKDGADKNLKISEMTAIPGNKHLLLNRITSTFGDNIILSSKTFRNSEYTVFIRINSNSPHRETLISPFKVYGQWNGMNLPEIKE